MKNQLKIGVILSYISTGLNIFIQLFYTPVMIRLLGQSEYGLYTLVSGFVSYLNLFTLGFTGAYLRFFSRQKARNDVNGLAQLNGMFLTLFLLMSAVAFVCGMALAQFPRQIFGSKLTNAELKTAQTLMRILVLNLALSFPAGLLESMVSAHEKFLVQRLVILIITICNPLLALPFLLMGYGSVAVVRVSTVLVLIKLISYGIYCIKFLRIRFIFHNFDFLILQEIAEFSFFLFLNTIVEQINWSVDKFILGRVSGTKAVAIYGVGSQINSLFIVFSATISSVFAPRINRIAAEAKTDMNNQFIALMTRVGRIQYLVLMLFASGFTIFGKYFITNIYSTVEYKDAYGVALLLILPGMISLIQNLGIEIQRAINKHKVSSVIYFGMAIFNVVISIPLAQKFGPIGSALGTAIGLVLTNGIIMNLYYRINIRLNITAFWKSILLLSRGMIIPAILGGAIMKWIRFNNLKIYFLFIILYSLTYLFIMWTLGMNAEEKKAVVRLMKR